VTTSTGQKYAGVVAGTDANSDVALVRVSGATGLTRRCSETRPEYRSATSSSRSVPAPSARAS